jgi:hypothetical protein
MALRVSNEEMVLLEGINARKDYVNAHCKKFPAFYKDSVAAGVKRAENVWNKRVEYRAVIEKQKHTVVVPSKVITKGMTNGKVESLPDHAEILVKILNELRIHTKQYEELLQIARAPKQHFTPVTTPRESYSGGNPNMTKTLDVHTAAEAIKGVASANK